MYNEPDGTRLFCTAAGPGRAVLLLPGWTCDGNDWSWQRPDSSQSLRTPLPAVPYRAGQRRGRLKTPHSKIPEIPRWPD